MRPIDKQEAIESRRLWYDVTQALLKTDFNSATLNKAQIEKQYKQQSNEFNSKYFIKKLANHCDDNNKDALEVKHVWIYKKF